MNHLPLKLIVLSSAILLSATPCCRGDGLADELKRAGGYLVFESHREGNWDLFRCKADGSECTNLTRTQDCDELYPHASPDGSKICFLADEKRGSEKVRNVYYMRSDGAQRELVASNGRDPCWSPDGAKIAYLPGEFAEYTLKDFASRGLKVYDLATGSTVPHVNSELHHLYNLAWSADGHWFVATVHGGMGFQHAILAIEAQGKRVVNLGIPGCRPDVSRDGKHIAWGASDFVLRMADVDWNGPKLVATRDLVSSEKPIEVYHVDWSNDGKYITFSRGPSRKTLGAAPEMIGAMAEGWDIWVATTDGTNQLLQITHDGKGNKEPDWCLCEKTGQ